MQAFDPIEMAPKSPQDPVPIHEPSPIEVMSDLGHAPSKIQLPIPICPPF